MSLIFNGTTITRINFNGVQMQKINFNGVTVFAGYSTITTANIDGGDWPTYDAVLGWDIVYGAPGYGTKTGKSTINGKTIVGLEMNINVDSEEYSMLEFLVSDINAPQNSFTKLIVGLDPGNMVELPTAQADSFTQYGNATGWAWQSANWPFDIWWDLGETVYWDVV
jgi:hypothetical protein